MLRKISSTLDLIFAQPFLYKYLRSFFLGGLPTSHVLNYLNTQPDEIIFDIGCGCGFVSELIKFRNYFGFDNNTAMLSIAKKRNVSNASYIETDITKYDFNGLSADKAIMYGMLHHLNDHDAVGLLNKLCGKVSKCIVTLDPVYATFHIINNLLCMFDRGKYVRTADRYCDLIAKTNWKIDVMKAVYANTKVAKYLVLRLTPKTHWPL